MTRLSLDSLTLTDTSPLDHIRAAGAAGFDLVSLWLNDPPAFPSQLTSRAIERDCASLMADTGVALHSIEAFDITSAAGVQAYRPALELGARLGGRSVLTYHGSNPDRAEVVGALAAFAELAGEYGLEIHVEPVAIAQTKTLAQAEALIRDAGVEAKIILDTCHLMRSGGSAADIRALSSGQIGYFQINDGPADISPDAMIAEAMGERLYPGEGAFPLIEILQEVPADIPWGIETPSLKRARAGMSPFDQAAEAMAVIRQLIARSKPEPATA